MRPPIRKSHALARYWSMLPWLVLAIGVPASLSLYTSIEYAVDSVARLRFERKAADAKAVIEARIGFYEDILHGLKALIASQGPVSRKQFHDFVQSLDLKNRYPGFDLVNFATYVPGHKKRQFEAAVRADTSLDPRGYPDFRINPPGDRAEYFVLVYLEPMAPFQFAFGLDLGANPGVADPEVLAATQRAARDSGRLSASGLPIHVKSPTEYVGLAMRMPVYRSDMPSSTVEERRAAYLGSVGAGFNVDNLMRGVVDEEARHDMRFTLHDVGSVLQRAKGHARVAERLLYDSHRGKSLAGDSAREPDSFFARALPMEVGGRVWEVRFTARKGAIISRVDALSPTAVLIGGLLSSVLLAGLFYSLASSRSRALELARHMTRDLRESEASLAEAQHISHLGNWSLERATETVAMSSEAWRILDVDPSAQGLPLTEFLSRVHEEDRAQVRAALAAATAARQKRDLEHRILDRAGGARWVHTIVQASTVDDDTTARGTMMDITERKLAEQELLESRALLNDAQKLSHVGCCAYSPADGRVVWSEELYRIHGVNPRAFVPTYEAAMQLVHPQDRGTWEEALARALRAGAPFAAEFRIVRPDGSVRHLRSLGEVVTDPIGKPSRMLWSVLDITEQKRTEDALRASAEQLTALSRRLVEVQEAERRQLSRELHDRVGQNLTALSINLDILSTALFADDEPEHWSRLSDSSKLLEATVDSIENVMAELRPPMLDDYGLLPALHWYAKAFSKRTAIEVDVVGPESAERVAPEIEIALFRIAQEALTNVAKHAQASHVQIELDHADGHCVMTVADDGIGIDGAKSANGRQRPGLGMVTMRERTQAVGGCFEVRTMPRGGTQIAIAIRTPRAP
jgi:PAS domain S-box-containing protein